MGTDTLIIPTYDGLNRRVVTHDNYTYYYYHNTDWQILEVRRNGEDHNPVYWSRESKRRFRGENRGGEAGFGWCLSIPMHRDQGAKGVGAPRAG